MLKVTQQFKANFFDADHRSSSVGEDTVTTWYLKPAKFKNMDAALFINGVTYMPIVVPGVNYLRVDVTVIFKEVLLQLFDKLNVNPQKTVSYIDNSIKDAIIVPPLTTNFMVEKITREYQDYLASVEIDVLHEQESGKLIATMCQTSVDLPKKVASLAKEQRSPMDLLSKHVEEATRVAAEQSAENSKYDFAQFANKSSLNPDQKGFTETITAIRSVNNKFIDSVVKWSQKQEKPVPVKVIQEALDSYLNGFLLSQQPLTVMSDLTAPTAFIKGLQGIKTQEEVLDYVKAFQIMGEYCLAEHLFSDKDWQVFKGSVVSGAEQLVAKVATPQDREEAYNKMLKNVFIGLVENRQDLLKDCLQNLSKDQLTGLKELINAAIKLK